MNQVSGFFPAIVLSFVYEVEIKGAKCHFVRDPLSPSRISLLPHYGSSKNAVACAKS